LREVPLDAHGRIALVNVVEAHLPDTRPVDTPHPPPTAGAEPSAPGARPAPGLADRETQVQVEQVGANTLDGDDDGIFVDHAGIVLLHPFLPLCLEGLGIARGTELALRDRALGVLHYLATGERAAPEYELVLAKVLCGVPISEPVAAVTLTDVETAEADALLEAAIRHWGALRSSGRDGLRHAFLMRPGKLSPEEGGDWLLRIEPRGADVLLDQLPWSLSMIQLPWMRRLLRVEWR